MGIFGKRKSREERAAELAEKVASGKGFYGRTTRAFLGNEDFAKVQQSMAAYNSGVTAQQLVAMGAPTMTASVVSIADTGRLINFDPVVDLVLQPAAAGADPIALQTIVSKLRIPREGDQVLLVADPANPGAHLYAGHGATP
ncbi:hypothetical protein ACIQKE_38810 [Streptomyces griseoviridis]|uniref:Uncharacterized protein n=2 Tax=Streptomyces TaxID=1883 RepID=A0A3Q9KP35_STRGD|nr:MULTISPECIES: hypothetical protein [Streptomyces]AZS85883.1 hypothetical protein ELQ87_17465 [Streptomyces griseoviridis]MDH6702622.1 hypothetical protein [Streptomyces sp. MAA16]MDT0476966.1 hypothetical protein [Streptomyces sp. DSM 41014]QCN87258.1 hypothetical protein DDJ31_21810 [Streptomyces griseoviridis]